MPRPEPARTVATFNTVPAPRTTWPPGAVPVRSPLKGGPTVDPPRRRKVRENLDFRRYPVLGGAPGPGRSGGSVPPSQVSVRAVDADEDHDIEALAALWSASRPHARHMSD